MRKAIIAILVTATVALAFIQIDDTHTQTILSGIKTFIPEIRFQATGGGPEYVGLVAPVVVNTPSVTYKLPTNDGTSGQALVTDGTADLSWATVGGGGNCPGGSDTQIQYNASNICGASSHFTFDYAHFRIAGTGLVPATDGTVPMVLFNGTFPLNNTGVMEGVRADIQSHDSQPFEQIGADFTLLGGAGGYGGVSSTYGLRGVNDVDSQGNNLELGTGNEPIANIGAAGEVFNTNVIATQIGALGRCHGNHICVGVYGKSDAQNNAGANVGVIGSASHGSDTDVATQIAVAALLGTSLPSVAAPGVALLADNGTNAMDIIQGMDNGIPVFHLLDTGGTAKNGISIQPAATGTPPVISSFGDTNTDLHISGSGDSEVVSNVMFQAPNYGAGGLPTCSSTRKGAQVVAIDCNAPCTEGGICTPGASTVCPLYCDGSAWKEF